MAEMKREIKSRACIKSHKGCRRKEREVKTTPLSPGKQHGRLSPVQGSGCKRHSVETSPLVHTNLGNKSTFITIMYFRHFKTKRKKKKEKKICPVAVISVMLGKSTMCWCFGDAPTNPDIWNPQKNCHCNETESHL